jgi:hypothetical protein
MESLEKKVITLLFAQVDGRKTDILSVKRIAKIADCLINREIAEVEIIDFGEA